MVFLAVIGEFVGIVALLVLSSLLRGYTLSVLWGWFMVPTLGLPHLSVVQAIGIAMVVSFLTYHDTSDIPKKERSTGEAIASGVSLAVLYPLIALLFGWVVHQYM